MTPFAEESDERMNPRVSHMSPQIRHHEITTFNWGQWPLHLYLQWQQVMWWRWLRAKLPLTHPPSIGGNQILIYFNKSTSWLRAPVLWLSQNRKLSCTKTTDWIWVFVNLNTNPSAWSNLGGLHSLQMQTLSRAITACLPVWVHSVCTIGGWTTKHFNVETWQTPEF